MSKTTLAVSLGAACTALLLTAFFAARAQTAGEYEGIPESPEFPRADLGALLDAGQTRQLRQHSWRVFREAVQPSTMNPALARWETWFDDAVTYSETGAPAPPTRGRTWTPRKDEECPPTTPAGDDRCAATILFNREAYDHIRNTFLYRPETYACLLRSGKTDVPAFPATSVAVKARWKIVSPTDPARIGVWDTERVVPGFLLNSDTQWKRQVCVATDPAQCPGEKFVPVDRFYNFPLKTEADVNRFRRVDRGGSFGKAAAGGYAILVGMHITTREIENWTWATFWWHLEPERGEFAEDRPELPGPWKNYLMAVSYDMDRPREPDGTPHVAQNPYIEAPLADGVNSNCMTCHRRATYPSDRDSTPVLRSDGSIEIIHSSGRPNIMVRGSHAAVETYLDRPFERRLKLSFLWTLGHAANKPLPAQYDCDELLRKVDAAVKKETAR